MIGKEIEIGSVPFPPDAEELAADAASEGAPCEPPSPHDLASVATDNEPELRLRQQELTHHLMNVISQSFWFDHLVLTGSHMMRFWFGEKARRPGDVDWLVRPQKLRGHHSNVVEMMEAMIAVARKAPDINGTRVVASGIEIRNISIYGQETGKRVLFPWCSDTGMHDIVQMDFCFGTELNHGIRPILFPLATGGALPLLAVTRQELLLWKLYWLHQDDLSRQSRGKDLYDAVLLAEETDLPFSLLEKAVPELAADSDMPLQWDVEWDEFLGQYPQVRGEAFDYQRRLWAALAPTFRDKGAT